MISILTANKPRGVLLRMTTLFAAACLALSSAAVPAAASATLLRQEGSAGHPADIENTPPTHGSPWGVVDVLGEAGGSLKINGETGLVTVLWNKTPQQFQNQTAVRGRYSEKTINNDIDILKSLGRANEPGEIELLNYSEETGYSLSPDAQAVWQTIRDILKPYKATKLRDPKERDIARALVQKELQRAAWTRSFQAIEHKLDSKEIRFLANTDESKILVATPGALANGVDMAAYFERIFQQLDLQLNRQNKGVSPSSPEEIAAQVGLHLYFWFPDAATAQEAQARLAKLDQELQNATEGKWRLNPAWVTVVVGPGAEAAAAIQTQEQNKIAENRVRRMIKGTKLLEAKNRALLAPGKEAKNAREAIINHYNAVAGGVLGILEEGGRVAEVSDAVPIKPADQLDGAAKVVYLQRTKEKKQATVVLGAGRATRMKMPNEFDRIGLAGLTPRIIDALPKGLGPKELKADQIDLDAKTVNVNGELLSLRDLINRAAQGEIADESDLSVAQRDLLQLRADVAAMVAEHGKAADVTLEEALAGLSFVFVVNETNREAIARQLAAINFAGLNPENVYVIEQDEQGGVKINPDGSSEWYDENKWPEGHGEPFLAMGHRAQRTYRFNAQGQLVPTGQPLTAALLGKGVEQASFARANDFHLFDNAAMAERWHVAQDLIQNGAGIVLEAMKNMPDANGDLPKGGQFFVETDTNGKKHLHLRDTIAILDESVAAFAFPKLKSRMLYFMDVKKLNDLQPEGLNQYISERTVKNPAGQEEIVLTREVVSGDISSAPGFDAEMISEANAELYDFKSRSGQDIESAMGWFAGQDRNGIMAHVEAAMASRTLDVSQAGILAVAEAPEQLPIAGISIVAAPDEREQTVALRKAMAPVIAEDAPSVIVEVAEPVGDQVASGAAAAAIAVRALADPTKRPPVEELGGRQDDSLDAAFAMPAETMPGQDIDEEVVAAMAVATAG